MTQPQPREENREISSHATKPAEKPTKRQRRRRRNSIEADLEALTLAPQTSLSVTLSMTTPIRLLVCSIGNPAPYTNTLHSAGHTVLQSLALALSYPSFQRSRNYGNGLVSQGEEYTLWQSSSLMNVSGTGVAAAWKQFLADNRGSEGRLVVVHDELELKLGEVRAKSGSLSPKGHNGLKSIKERLGGVEYTRIGVGIGRPESRDPDTVADYVLRKMSQQERTKVEGAAGRVAMELQRLVGS
jgi:PTH1 family peptidyl-tRNA hydrolase